MDPYGTQSLRSWRKALGRHLQHFCYFRWHLPGKTTKNVEKQYKDKSWIMHPNQSVTSATGFAAFTGLQRLQPEVPGPSPEAPGSKRDCTTWPMPSARNGTWMTCPESLRRVRDALSKSWWRKRMKPCYNSGYSLSSNLQLNFIHHANYSATWLHPLPQLKWFQDFQVSCQSLLTQPLGPNVDRARRGQYHPKLPTNSTVSRPQNSTIRNKSIRVTFRGIVEMILELQKHN